MKSDLILYFSFLVILVCCKVFNIRDYGAKGDGKTLDTQAFVKAFEAASSSGGGTVLVPYNESGSRYLTSPFNLTSNTVLEVEEKSFILGVQDFAKYPVIAPLPSYGKSRDEHYARYQSLIFGVHVKNVRITGKGIIDGQGDYWWKARKEGKLKEGRPRLIELAWSQNIEIDSVTLQNSPFWTLHPVYCDNVYIHDITIQAPSDSPNTDGVDPDSSSNVVIERVNIPVNGDDWIAIKSGIDEAGLEYNWPTKNVTVRDCKFSSRGAIAIGSETSGGIYDIFIYNNIIESGSECLRLKTARGRGGTIQNVHYENMDLSACRDRVLQIDMYYSHIPPTHNKTTTPVLKDIYYTNITTVTEKYGENEVESVNFNCLPESPCTGIQMSHVHLRKDGKYTCENAYGTQVDVTPKVCLKQS